MIEAQMNINSRQVLEHLLRKRVSQGQSLSCPPSMFFQNDPTTIAEVGGNHVTALIKMKPTLSITKDLKSDQAMH
jgi:hypothetical protein